MPSPIPKDPKTRQRRNKPKSGARLAAAPAAGCPDLPELRRDGEEWHPATRKWWDDVWASPMAAQYLEVEVHGLVDVAEARDRAAWKWSVETVRAIEMLERRFGLTPLDRRRLEWEIAKVEAAKDRSPARPATPGGKRDDPRRLLAAVK